MEITKERNQNSDIVHIIKESRRRNKEQKNMPHEFIFLQIILKECKNPEVAAQFVNFIIQFFPNYNWKWCELDNLQSMAIMEIKINTFTMQRKFDFKDQTVTEEQYSTAKLLGEIATEFCIRTLDYNLIGIGGAKTILTCDDVLNETCEYYFNKGYEVFKLRKLYYIKDELDFLGYFEEIPALPIKEYNNMNFFVEDKEHKFQRVLK